jgi:thymidylate synthase (FAD)
MQVDNTVELIDHMGSDLTVVNAARVSFGKRKETFTISDVGLVQYLAKHNHWSPFGHASLQFHIKAPVFVARQLVKHQVGLVWNEISRRYVDDEPEFCKVDSWRARAENKKQGSDETKTIDEVYPPESDWKFPTSSLKEQVETLALRYYNTMLEYGVAPEQARMILPQSMMTEWYWSGTLYAFARVCNLRCKPDAQLESREVCDMIDKQAAELFPVSWKSLRDE